MSFIPTQPTPAAVLANDYIVEVHHGSIKDPQGNRHPVVVSFTEGTWMKNESCIVWARSPPRLDEHGKTYYEGTSRMLENKYHVEFDFGGFMNTPQPTYESLIAKIHSTRETGAIAAFMKYTRETDVMQEKAWFAGAKNLIVTLASLTPLA